MILLLLIQFFVLAIGKHYGNEPSAEHIGRCLLEHNISNYFIQRIVFDDIPPFELVLTNVPDGVTDTIKSEKVWERHISRGIIKALREKSKQGKFLDVGANIGWFTALALADGHRVIAVEASKNNAQLIKATACVNSFRGLRLHNIAVSNTSQTCGVISHSFNVRDWNLVCPEDNIKYMDQAMDAQKQPRYTRRGYVRTTHLDDLISFNDHVAVAKIDVEGHEELMMRGATETFGKQKIHSLFTELTPWSMAVSTEAGAAHRYIEHLRNYGFKCVPELSKESIDVAEKKKSGMFDLECTKDVK